jgi:hypothetical protein
VGLEGRGRERRKCKIQEEKRERREKRNKGE